MFRNKSKIVVLLIAFIMLVSTISFATDTEITDRSATTPGENARTQEEGTSSEGEETTPINEETPVNEGDDSTSEIHNGDLYLFGIDVKMDKLVDGNVFIIGQNVEVTGRVNGSLYVMANKVSFGENSYIVQSIYAYANEITINGAANDLYAKAKKIDMNYNAFMIRDLRISADTFNFAGGVGRNAFVNAGKFHFETESDKSAIIYGNLEYSASTELNLSKELVQGEVKYSQGIDKSSVSYIVIETLINIVFMVIATLLVYLVMSLFTPNFIESLSKYVGKKSLVSLGIGLLGVIIVSVVSAILVFTLVGTMAFSILVNVLAVIVNIAYIVLGIAIANKISEKFKLDKKYKKILILIGIITIFGILKAIPYVGNVIYAVIELIGFGIIILQLYSKIKKTEVKEK